MVVQPDSELCKDPEDDEEDDSDLSDGSAEDIKGEGSGSQFKDDLKEPPKVEAGESGAEEQEIPKEEPGFQDILGHSDPEIDPPHGPWGNKPGTKSEYKDGKPDAGVNQAPRYWGNILGIFGALVLTHLIYLNQACY